MGYDKEKRKLYLEKNKEKIKKQKQDNYKKNRERYIEYQKNWSIDNKDKITKNRQKRLSTDPLFKLKTNIKTLIGHTFRFNRIRKLSKTEIILGCSYEEFKQHLESKFEPWMNWDNRGLYNGELNYGWDIDHIIPISLASTEEEIIKLNHYTNLQPLCSKINRDIKRDIY